MKASTTVIALKFTVEHPTELELKDLFDRALDAGSIQNLIISYAEDEGYDGADIDFTDASVTGAASVKHDDVNMVCKHCNVAIRRILLDEGGFCTVDTEDANCPNAPNHEPRTP